ncbi:hypothetical protein C4D60_Mb07t07630 [Musa balbisiana]|uniref:Uncharacterized protein n=1 Tax=Musa balbisiana TaxID=52838 RepID=A0A4S8JDN4_MUSBA|nr:hypothetical protein C4D60_Mb07t07630 [Musa balbisiana]
MTAHAHLSWQISTQMSTQVSTQVSVPSQQLRSYMMPQMQSLGPRPMDSELQNVRSSMRQKINCKEVPDALGHSPKDLGKARPECLVCGPGDMLQ